MHSLLFILPVLSTVFCAGLGLFTLTRNPRQPANIGFFLGMLSLAVIGAGYTVILYFGAEVHAATPGIRLALTGQALLVPAWLFFSVVFARANFRDIFFRNLLIIAATGAVSAYFIVRAGSPGLILLAEPGMEGGVYDGAARFMTGPIGRQFYIYLVLGLVLNLVHLENTLRSSRGSKRWQIKYVIFGVGAILAIFVYLSSQALLFSTQSIESILLASSVILISTLMMAVFIVRHRLMDVDVFVSRYVVYNSLTVLIVGLYLVGTAVVVHGVRYFNAPLNSFFTTLIVFVATLALVILFFTTTFKRKLQLSISRHFYKHKYEFRDKWMETIEKVCSKRSIDETATTFIEMVSDIMGARRVYLWIYDPVSKTYRSTDELLAEDPRSIAETHPLVGHINSTTGPFMLDAGVVGEAVELISLKKATGAVLCSPLVAGTELVGFMLQGEDISGETYRKDDFELLKAMTTQAAVQIKGIRLAEDILNAKEVEAFHRLSSFIVHDLKNLTNSLSLVSQNARENMDNPEFQKDAIRTINNTVTRMKGLMDKLSTLPSEVELRRESVGLRSLVHRAIKKIPVAEGRNVTILNEVEPAESVNVDPEAMDMVILNLLKNAFEAIDNEGRITVCSALDNGKIDLTISDNGAGMSPEYVRSSLFRPFKTTKTGGFGIGLFQCKAIVDAHGGNIEVQSTEGRGTTFKVTLPSASTGSPSE